MADKEILKRALGTTPECPPIEVLSGILQRAAEDPERRAAEAHVDHCFHCKTEVGLLQEFESGVIRADEKDAVRWISSRLAAKPAPGAATAAAGWWQRWSTPRVLTSFAAAAVVFILAIALSTQWAARARRERTVPEFGNEIQRSQSIEVIRNPGAFQWNRVPGAAKYELTVREVAGSTIFHNTFTSQTLAYPPEVVRIISTQKVLLWDVIARDPAGNEIARSPIQRIQQKSSANQ